MIIETAAFVVATMISFVATRRREAFVRSRFEQHLAPAVVRRILERPGMLKLSGERREVTALFTDVEGFTAMTHHVDPAILVNALDNYFEGMATIIITHGGMIDKIVGDAVHALFNAPNDLKDHPQKAVECAIALCSWSEAFRHRPEVAMIGFGRTRIGIETGPAIVGDVGIRAKLDYTAHGDAVNLAARLEAANKKLGSSICIGPVAASRCDQSLLRPLGKIIVRGRDDVIVDIPVVPGATPIGKLEEEIDLTKAKELLPPLISAAVVRSFAGARDIVSDRPVTVLGSAAKGLVQHRDLPEWIERRTALEFDTRSLYLPGGKRVVGITRRPALSRRPPLHGRSVHRKTSRSTHRS